MTVDVIYDQAVHVIWAIGGEFLTATLYDHTIELVRSAGAEPPVGSGDVAQLRSGSHRATVVGMEGHPGSTVVRVQWAFGKRLHTRQIGIGALELAERAAGGDS